MKLRKSVFLLSSLMMLSVGVGFVNGVENTVNVAEAANYTETSFQAGKLLITTVFDGSTYYLPATTSTSSGPSAASFTNVNDISEDHLWTVTATGSNWYIQNSEGNYLYTTATNNGVRVGPTVRAWSYDATSNYFKDTSTNRYLGIYNASNWRCYTSVNQSNYKESSTSFVFYAADTGAPSVSVSGDSNTQIGGTINLSATLANIEGDVTWSSSDTSVVTVENGVVTAKAMGSATITADVNGTSGTKEIKVYPTADSELSIEELLTVCELTEQTNSPYSYSTTGKVSSIDTAYSSSYDNITITLTDGTNSISCYRLAGGSNLAVGDEIIVKGNVVNQWGTTAQFVQGSTFEYVNKGQLSTPTVSFDETNAIITWNEIEGASGYHLYVLDAEANEVFNDKVNATSYDVSAFANGTYIVTVKALGNNNYTDSLEGDLEFTLAQGTAAQFAAVETKSSLGFAYSSETIGGESEVISLASTNTVTGNFDVSTNVASQMGYTGSDLEIYTEKGSASNNVGYNKDGSIRIYYNASGSNIITVTNKSTLIKSVTIEYTGESYANGLIYTDDSAKITGTTSDNVTYTYEINANTFYITNGNTSNTQVRFYNMDLECGNSTTTYTFSDVRVRFNATIAPDVYESLNITKAGFEVVAAGYEKAMDIDCTGKFDIDEEGNYFIICSIWNIPEEAYDTELTAKAYFEVEGTRYYAESTTYSVRSLAETYLSDAVFATLTENAQDAVKAFNEQLA